MRTSFVISFAVEGVLLAFHVSVFVVVLSRALSGRMIFTTSFTVLYLLQSLADFGSYAMVSSFGPGSAIANG